MKTSIDLASFIGAQEVMMDGQLGVFIPYVPNCTVIQFKRRKLAIASIKFYTSLSKKTFDMKGKLFIPKEHLDRCISDPRLVKKRDTIAWLWNENRSYGELVSSEDFYNAIGDD